MQKRNWQPCFLWLMLVSGGCLTGWGAETAQDNAWVQGTIVSVRGNILVIRPQWRPKPKRVAFGDKTEIALYERVTRSALKPGRRISLGGRYNATEGLRVNWVEVIEAPGFTTPKYDGLIFNQERTYANGGGTLKSVSPFVFADDKGKEFKADVSKLRGIWRMIRGNRNQLLIGTRVEVQGQDMPDEVLRASHIYPDRSQAPFGTMFGTILSIQGNRIEIRPRFTSDKLAVSLKPACRFMQQATLPENAIKVGQHVTFWGEARGQSGGLQLEDGDKPSDVKALALVLGNNRFPSAQGENAPRYYSGQLISLEPNVQLKLPSGQAIRILPTAQMPIARLNTITLNALHPGQEAMFVLSRHKDSSFETSTIILDASPWVGYGG
ncbi:MAG: hypothetical protein JO316_00055 [Abitibacteriaceae bacterium]|nr:hypothetical protein [Abditibacteriaceae bacterium]